MSPFPAVFPIFLDYDGVLQRPAVAHTRDFEFLPQFEQLLRDYPFVAVVITSTDRNGASLKQLRALYSPDLQQRILGGTPDLVDGRKDGGRFLEIQAFLSERGWEELSWLALDDEAWLYPPECPQLVLTSKYAGFDEAIEAEVRRRLDLIFTQA